MPPPSQLGVLWKFLQQQGGRKSLTAPVFYYEALCMALFVSIFVFDVLGLMTARGLKLSSGSTTQHVDLWSLGSHLRNETGEFGGVVSGQCFKKPQPHMFISHPAHDHAVSCTRSRSRVPVDFFALRGLQHPCLDSLPLPSPLGTSSLAW